MEPGADPDYVPSKPPSLSSTLGRMPTHTSDRAAARHSYPKHGTEARPAHWEGGERDIADTGEYTGRLNSSASSNEQEAAASSSGGGLTMANPRLRDKGNTTTHDAVGHPAEKTGVEDPAAAGGAGQQGQQDHASLSRHSSAHGQSSTPVKTGGYEPEPQMGAHGSQLHEEPAKYIPETQIPRTPSPGIVRDDHHSHHGSSSHGHSPDAGNDGRHSPRDRSGCLGCGKWRSGGGGCC